MAAEAFHWKLFMSVFCTAMFTHMTAYLIEHPVDSIEENQMISRDQVNAAVAKIPSESISSDNVGD